MLLTVLMYHHVAPLPASGAHVGNYVTPDQFGAQLDALHAWGYRPVVLADWLAWLDAGTPLPARPVVLTFDDAYVTVREHAVPHLRRHGARATIFAVSGLLGGTNSWDRDPEPSRLLSADELRALAREGMEIGSHSHTHRRLARCTPDEVRSELLLSRQVLGEVLGHPVTAMCYPYGSQGRRVRRLTREAGYRCGVGTKRRVNARRTDRYDLRRIPVDSTVTLEALERTLAWRRRLWWVPA